VRNWIFVVFAFIAALYHLFYGMLFLGVGIVVVLVAHQWCIRVDSRNRAQSSGPHHGS
jgi:hypothetical protein